MNDDAAATYVEDYALNDIEPHLSIDAILALRHTVHGDFTDDACIAQAIKHQLRQGRNWEELTSFQKEALEQIATKIGRIVSGNPNHKDHWSDVQGYARLVEERL